MNSPSSSFIALSISIPYLYLLAIAAHSFSVSAMVVGIRVGIRVIVSLKKSESGLRLRSRLRSRSRLRLRLRSRLRSGVYILYSRQACKVFLSKTLFSQQSVVLAVKPVQILLSFEGGVFQVYTCLQPQGLQGWSQQDCYSLSDLLYQL